MLLLEHDQLHEDGKHVARSLHAAKGGAAFPNADFDRPHIRLVVTTSVR